MPHRRHRKPARAIPHNPHQPITPCKISDKWTITVVQLDPIDDVKYILEERSYNGDLNQEEIDDPLLIELFNQLVAARALNEAMGELMEPYVTIRKEQKTANLLENNE